MAGPGFSSWRRRQRRAWLGVLLGGLAAGAAAGCTPGLLGAGGAVAAGAAQERGFGRAVADTAIRTEINARWLDHDATLVRDLGLSVSEGRVLLTGRTATVERRIAAVRLAWTADGVREVINEIEVGAETAGLEGYACDSWITTRLRSRLVLDESARSIKYSIDTDDGTIYLMGIARDRDELVRVIHHARTLPYVRRVVNHVRLGDATRSRS
ncbi:MAG: BON domain-containing protein [Alphaproteobacteria bacterium]|nr:BON domain-containing protein [Alphaproteobacteria bacterium]